MAAIREKAIACRHFKCQQPTRRSLAIWWWRRREFRWTSGGNKTPGEKQWALNWRGPISIVFNVNPIYFALKMRQGHWVMNPRHCFKAQLNGYIWQNKKGEKKVWHRAKFALLMHLLVCNWFLSCILWYGCVNMNLHKLGKRSETPHKRSRYHCSTIRWEHMHFIGSSGLKLTTT